MMMTCDARRVSGVAAGAMLLLLGCELEPLPCSGRAAGDEVVVDSYGMVVRLLPRSATVITWSGEPTVVVTPTTDACAQMAGLLGLATPPRVASWLFVSVGGSGPGAYQVVGLSPLPLGPEEARVEAGHVNLDTRSVARVVAVDGFVTVSRFDFDPAAPELANVEGSYEITFSDGSPFSGQFTAPSCAACFAGPLP